MVAFISVLIAAGALVVIVALVTRNPTATAEPMRSAIAVLGASMLFLTGCSVFKDDAPSVAHGVGDAIVGAAHDHVKVTLPNIPRQIDLGDVPLSSLRGEVRGIFGDETKENVNIVCRAKELAATDVTDTSEGAIRQVLNTLDIKRSDDEIRRLAQETERAIESGVSPNELTRAAVVWACQWAAS
jgi:hypothetical protein